MIIERTTDDYRLTGLHQGVRTPRLSLVVPAFNEARRLADGMPRLLDVIPRDETEVIVVDDGSTDGTADVARRHLAALPRRVVIRLPKNTGKGAAVRAGVVEARGEIIAYMDADMATDPEIWSPSSRRCAPAPLPSVPVRLTSRPSGTRASSGCL